jgi:hypothetical protein
MLKQLISYTDSYIVLTPFIKLKIDNADLDFAEA